MDKFYQMMEYMTIGASLHDEFGNFIYSNPAFEKLFDINSASIENKKFNKESFNILSGDFIEFINFNFQNIDNKIIKIYKNNIPCWIRINSIKLINGKTTYLLTYEDISETISYSSLYEEIFQNIKTGILVVKVEEKNIIIKDINPYGMYLSKVNDKFEIIGKNLKDTNLPIHDNKYIFNIIKNVYKTKKTKELKQYKCILNKKEIWRNYFFYKVKSGEIVILYTDITETITIREKLEKADKMKTTYLSNMSHEIRSPINAIVGFSDLLEYSDDKETQKHYIDIIKNSSKILTTLIDDILDLSKIEAGKLTISKSNFNIETVLSEIYITNKALINDDVYFILNLVPTNIILNNDEYRFRQILNNFLSNSIKFTNKGFIELGVKLENNCVIFYVKDSGIGIKEEDKSKIFNRFQKSHNKPGNGLGLCISKELSKLMNGDIWFESIYEKETTFYLKLPYEYTTTYVEKTKIIKENIPDLSDKTVFIVEDILFNTTLLISYLEPTKANIITSDNGNDALIKFNDNKDHIDLILMDIQLPEMDGIEITGIIRTIDENVPIIAQTAYAMKDEIEKMMQSGFNDVIKKPIKREELFCAINRCMNL